MLREVFLAIFITLVIYGMSLYMLVARGGELLAWLGVIALIGVVLLFFKVHSE